MSLDVRSTIPIAAGLGSGVAVSIAVLRAFAAFFHQVMSIHDQSNLAWEVEKIHHGTPSGIDNTVVAHGRTVYFVRDRAPEFPTLGARLYLAVADSGQSAPTAQAVAHVRARREAARTAVDAALDRIGEIVDAARLLLESGGLPGLGRCMHENHTLLQSLGVSTATLDRMAGAAERAGALGAKLTGAGQGGNLIALLPAPEADDVQAALLQAGARRVFTTEIAT
jgi:mevalonate kinase